MKLRNNKTLPPTPPNNPTPPAAKPVEAKDVEYKNVMKDELFKMLPANKLWVNGVIPQEPSTLYSLTKGNGIKACLKPLGKEITNLATLLPCHHKASIFVRCEESRIDGMKVFMTGPVGTPYAFGCFEFNVNFPSNYPQVPPNMQLLTTGGGTVRFNPNLYNCGKICVSLLGTWSAQNPEERWQPGKSTLLQVLVSVQSLIMNEHPYFNEPGYGAVVPTNPQSIAYNQNLHIQTTRFAILGQLQAAEAHNGSGFGKIIRNHFYLSKDEVKKQLKSWEEAANPAMRAQWKKLIKDVDGELEKLVKVE
ncbi:Baculoviral IAP repeat-containing protein 6 [Podochytrium sp. JEL0797]|nr:Baculoviral IAP repeat-containing protein 6 [Podochytrium sp. JEL0797]